MGMNFDVSLKFALESAYSVSGCGTNLLPNRPVGMCLKGKLGKSQ